MAKETQEYKTICISIYLEDEYRLRLLVAELKSMGDTSASKSKIIREALKQVNLNKIPGRRKQMEFRFPSAQLSLKLDET